MNSVGEAGPDDRLAAIRHKGWKPIPQAELWPALTLVALARPATITPCAGPLWTGMDRQSINHCSGGCQETPTCGEGAALANGPRKRSDEFAF